VQISSASEKQTVQEYGDTIAPAFIDEFDSKFCLNFKVVSVDVKNRFFFLSCHRQVKLTDFFVEGPAEWKPFLWT
jgi:hypothetical protein